MGMATGRDRRVLGGVGGVQDMGLLVGICRFELALFCITIGSPFRIETIIWCGLKLRFGFGLGQGEGEEVSKLSIPYLLFYTNVRRLKIWNKKV